MALITSNATLESEIAAWLNRTDLTTQIPTFVQVAEKSLGRDERLRKLKSATLTVDAEEENVPSDFHSLKSMTHDGGTYFGALDVVDASALPGIKARNGGVSGVPSHVAVLDGKFRFAPVPNATFTLDITYNQSIGSVTAGTSWLFTASPDLYLYASLVAAAPFLHDDERLAVWSALLEKEIEAVRLETWNTHFSGTPVRRQFRPIG